MSYFPGKNASVTITSTARTNDKFSVKAKSEIIDTTSFVSQGWQTNEAGIFSVDLTFEGPYNGAHGFAQGDAITPTFGCGGAGPSLVIPCRVSEIGVDTAARNQVARSPITATSNGVVSIVL